MHCNLVIWKVGEGLQVWKKMLQARDLIEHQICWNSTQGAVSFYHENWTGMGDLYTIIGEDEEWNDFYHTTKKVTKDDAWDFPILEALLPKEIAYYIIQSAKLPNSNVAGEKPYLMLDTKRRFTVKTAWNYI